MAKKGLSPLLDEKIRKLVDAYAYRVQWSEEDQEHVGLCSEFQFLSWLEKDADAAFKGIRAVVAEVVAEKLAAGKEVPEPIATRRYSGVFKVRIPPEVHRGLAHEAAEEGVSLNRLVSVKLSR